MTEMDGVEWSTDYDTPEETRRKSVESRQANNSWAVKDTAKLI